MWTCRCYYLNVIQPHSAVGVAVTLVVICVYTTHEFSCHVAHASLAARIICLPALIVQAMGVKHNLEYLRSFFWKWGGLLDTVTNCCDVPVVEMAEEASSVKCVGPQGHLEEHPARGNSTVFSRSCIWIWTEPGSVPGSVASEFHSQRWLAFAMSLLWRCGILIARASDTIVRAHAREKHPISLSTKHPPLNVRE